MTDPGREIQIMGILNLNEDSFYAPSRYNMTVLESGADIIDLGAVSSRPGADEIGPDEEWRKLEPVLRILDSSVRLSIDTTSSIIVKRAAQLLGREFIVNDISAGHADSAMLTTVAELGLGYIAMHMRGTPKTMQSQCNYSDITNEIMDYFRNFEREADSAGIKDWILDPGFGFAKTTEQNFTLMRELGKFKSLGKKILVGISRKSFIYKSLNISPEESLPAVSAMHLETLVNGADILRVHDVAEARRIVMLYRNYSSM